MQLLFKLNSLHFSKGPWILWIINQFFPLNLIKNENQNVKIWKTFCHIHYFFVKIAKMLLLVMCVFLSIYFFYFKKRNLYLYEAFSTSLCPMFHKPTVLPSASLCAHHSTRGFWFYRYFPILPFVFNYRLVVILRDRCEFSPQKPCLFSGLRMLPITEVPAPQRNGTFLPTCSSLYTCSNFDPISKLQSSHSLCGESQWRNLGVLHVVWVSSAKLAVHFCLVSLIKVIRKNQVHSTPCFFF